MGRTAAKQERDGWAPRSYPGGVYCSPLCGGRCKRADYDAAHRAANDLAKRMGDGWTPSVWENLGWHWSVEKGAMTIRQWGDQFTAQFDISDSPVVQVFADAETPEDALGFALQEARGLERRIAAACSDLSV